MSAQPPPPDPPVPPVTHTAPDAPPLRSPSPLRCPRCSADVAPDQDWCLECGAPARTRLAPTPNWQLPTVAIGAIVLIAGALLAFAFVKLTGDDSPAPAGTTPVIATQPPAAPPAVQPTATIPTTTNTTPTTPRQSTTTPGSTTPGTVKQPPTTVPGQTDPSTKKTRTAQQPGAGD